MTSTSQATFAWQAEASQSERLRSTSSTKSYLSAGRKRRNTFCSSADLIVMVQTVCFAAAANGGSRQAVNRQSTRRRIAGWRMALDPVALERVHGPLLGLRVRRTGLEALCRNAPRAACSAG